MFGWGINTTVEGAKLVLTVPFHWLACLVSVFPILIIVGLSAPLTRRKIFWVTLLAFFWFGILMYGSRTTFDKQTNTVTVKEFWFGYRTTQFPLDKVDSMFVRSGDTVSQLCLQRTDGSVISVSLRDQNVAPGSKDKAAYQVNQWLGGTATPAGRP